MIDGHIHFEKQPYSLEIVENMVKTAMEKGIDEIWLLDHTHKFKEFSFLYQNLKEDLTVRWYSKKSPISIWEFIQFKDYIQSKKWPIKIKFGLEVCYFPETEDILRKVLDTLPKFDFLIGSVHFEFGTAIDINKELQDRFNIRDLYIEYFEIQKKAVRSRLFDVIGHPDAIKQYGNYPDEKLYLELIEDFAKELSKYNQQVENNSGLLRHGFPYGGMSKEMIEIFDKYNIKYHRSSDAHKFEDIGRAFDTLKECV
ncbi:MAG: histidinol-phosphatase HisJ family protein [Bacilli bacterium]|nr:histidinol-phosphatase HisJ family protein [Bacilli bacterium]